jgi:hypothetical protein
MQKQDREESQDALFHIGQALLVSGPEQKLPSGCEICQQCFFLHSILLRNALGIRGNFPSQSCTMQHAKIMEE